MVRLKKTLAGALAACLTTALPSAWAAQTPTFTDVPTGPEYAAAVAYVTEKGLMQGYGNGLLGWTTRSPPVSST